MTVVCYLIVVQQLWGGYDLDGDWHDGVDYLPHGVPSGDRAALIATTEAELGHDDFNVLTVVAGQPTAFGHGMDDFGPDEDGVPHGGYCLAEIARQALPADVSQF